MSVTCDIWDIVSHQTPCSSGSYDLSVPSSAMNSEFHIGMCIRYISSYLFSVTLHFDNLMFTVVIIIYCKELFLRDEGYTY